MRMLRRVWKDDAGFVVSTELVLVATILVIGMIVGLATVRNTLVQELGDVALAFNNIVQSYVYSGVAGRDDSSQTAGSDYTDRTDFCDGGLGWDCLGCPPSGISVKRNPLDEGVPLAP